MKINANGTEINVIGSSDGEDYISLTDLARYRNSDDPAGVIANWLRNRNTIDYLGLWEQMYNPEFKLLEFEEFKNTLAKMRLLCLLKNGLPPQTQ